MLFNKFSIFVVIFLVSLTILANSSKIIYKTDPEYLYKELSSIENGTVFLSNQHAVTKREFLINHLAANTSTNEGAAFDYRITLRPYLSGFYSPYYHYNSYPLPLLYTFEDQMDFLTFQIAMSLDETVYITTDYSIGASCTELSGPGSYHPFSLSYYAAGNTPDEGYISFSKEHLSLTIGRFKGGIGHGLAGNLFQNSRAPYYDQFRAYSKRVKISYMLGTSNYQLNNDELQVQNNTPVSQDYDKTWGAVYEKTVQKKKTSENLKMFAFHRIELKPFDVLHLGFGEMNLVGGKFPDINMVNPFGMYHDTYDKNYHSYTFLFDIAYTPFKRNMFFFEFLSNDINAPGERNQDPTAVGFQGGYWYIVPVQSSAKHRVGIELTHLDTWTYSDTVPYLTMYQRQVRRDAIYDIPLGYSFGGDCEHFSLLYTLVDSSGLYASLSLQRLHKGEINFEIKEDGSMPYESAYKYQARPSGTVEKWSTVEGKLVYPINDMMTIRTNGHYSYIENLQNKENNNAHFAYVSSGVSIEF